MTSISDFDFVQQYITNNHLKRLSITINGTLDSSSLAIENAKVLFLDIDGGSTHGILNFSYSTNNAIEIKTLLDLIRDEVTYIPYSIILNQVQRDK